MRVTPQTLLSNGYNFDIDSNGFYNHYYKSKLSWRAGRIRIEIETKKLITVIYFDVRHPFNKIESYIKNKHHEK